MYTVHVHTTYLLKCKITPSYSQPDTHFTTVTSLMWLDALQSRMFCSAGTYPCAEKEIWPMRLKTLPTN